MSPSRPSVHHHRRLRGAVASLAAVVLAVAGLATAPGGAATEAEPATARQNLAAGQPTTASSHTDVYVASNATDGDQSTYWESANHTFPQWLQVDLGAAVTIDELALKLPTVNWAERTQTITVETSTDGSEYTTFLPITDVVFDPAEANTARLSADPTPARYVRLTFTANTGWPAAQLAELEVYRPSDGDTEPPTPPGELSFTESEPGQVELSWGASMDNVGVVAYDIYANGALLTSVDGDVLSYVDTRSPADTVTYTVRARDAAGNTSAPSNAVTRTGTGGSSTDLAAGKPIQASSSVHVFEATNANDGDVTTYWEGAPGAYPSTLTVALGADAVVDEVVVRLNPDPIWAARTQTLEVLGRSQDGGEFSTLVSQASYDFDPATGNTVTIPVGATVADLRLQFTANTGAPNGQVAELLVMGTPAPNPDLVITGMSWEPGAPDEVAEIELSAIVENVGDRPAGATTVDFLVADQVSADADLEPLAAGDQATVTATLEPLAAGSYTVGAEVDPDGLIVERDDTNNTYHHDDPIVVTAIESSDLVPEVSWTPAGPGVGDEAEFQVTITNQGNIDTAAGPHDVTLTVSDGAGAEVHTLTGAHDGVIGAGDAATLALGSWTVAEGRYQVTVEVAPDANEHPVKQGNNTVRVPLMAGRGATLPFDIYEAEDGTVGGGAQVVGPNRSVGDPAGEASGRQAVTLNTTGAYVEFASQADTNTLVVRASIPDAPGGGGITDTLNIYVDGDLLAPITLTSRYSWLYGNEANPGTSPGLGDPRHIYDEANILFDEVIPAGSTIRLQKDPENTTTYAVDFISLEHAEPVPNPDPARYVEPAGFGHADVQAALDQVRMDSSGDLLGVYLPPGDYQTAQKFQVYGRSIEILGAGPWFTRFYAPQTQANTDVGFQADSSMNGSTFRGFAYFGNYTSRIDGPGKVFDFQNVADITIDDVWVEHFVCMYWGANTDNMTITNSRMRNLWADGMNMTNGSANNLVSNVEARGTGDDSFALFAATDLGGGEQTGNVYENLTSLVTWRAAGLAVYGGYDNVFRDIYIADTLVYSGVTISSLDFGYPFDGFGASPPTRFENITIERAGGHFWGGQTFPGIWLFSASKEFQGIRISDVDIIDPTYIGIMFQTNYVGGQPQNPVTDTVLTNVSITGAQRSGDEYDHKSGIGIWVNEMPEAGQGPAVGSATFSNLTLSGNAEDVRNSTDTFTLVFDD
ncbi:discoidin domain-containing protein [Phytoactinopolyspora limicola]|uniref:discoidin domain-containing protein n=1 Tax=Phytoactinopolyspora limicola TaxID=2715536 RepID=UPI001A9CB191|nr:discoidin domain-containing protein [Phytoactinopolyspora limicola]